PEVRNAAGTAGRCVAPAPALVERPPEWVVGDIQARPGAPILLGRVTRAAAAARHRLVRVLRRGEEEVDRVLGAVEEWTAVGLRGRSLVLVGRLALLVRLPLALGVRGEHDVARLRERLGSEPVEPFGGLERAVGDDDAGSLRGTCSRRPHVAGDRRAGA